MGRRMKSATREQQDADEVAHPKYNGLHCAECHELQFDTSSGPTCKNGHGGAEGIGPQDVANRKNERAAMTSTALAEEIDQAKDEDRTSQARIRFASANAGKRKPMKAEIVRIADTMIIRDVEPQYHKIVGWLSLGDMRTERAHLLRQLDEAQMMSRNAFLLYITVKNAREAWEKTNDVFFAAMKLEANRELQKEKDAKQRNKQITDADVATMCATLFGDQWVSDSLERAKYTDFESTLKDLYERCRERAYDLRVAVGALR